MNEGATISFETLRGTIVRAGVVLSVDEYLSLPIRVEYIAENGDKRIERFHPDEFKRGVYVH